MKQIRARLFKGECKENKNGVRECSEERELGGEHERGRESTKRVSAGMLIEVFKRAGREKERASKAAQENL